MKATTQLEKDIAFCIDELDLANDQIGELLRACEKLGNISCEYFCEEFIFECDTEEELDRLHNDNYLKINWGLS
jgi:hypothetical protein